MAKILFITATNTNIGKTYASIQILKKLALIGYKVGACKPIETGVDNIPQDAHKLLTIVKQNNNRFKHLTPLDITAYSFKLPAAPFVADTKGIINIAKVCEKIMELSSYCDILVVEGAGGLMVPIKRDYFMIDLIKELDAKTLLVTPSYLGSINETLLSIKALEDKDIDFDWVVNLYRDKEEFKKITKPFYDAYFKEWQTLDEYIKTLS
ncbi:MAG: dethiobiotin synthase [Epsilonproteobacteria bacterium]|nr:dethiobiotin synthase [Campylobacterota bacterium]